MAITITKSCRWEILKCPIKSSGVTWPTTSTGHSDLSTEVHFYRGCPKIDRWRSPDGFYDLLVPRWDSSPDVMVLSIHNSTNSRSDHRCTIKALQQCHNFQLLFYAGLESIDSQRYCQATTFTSRVITLLRNATTPAAIVPKAVMLNYSLLWSYFVIALHHPRQRRTWLMVTGWQAGQG